MARACMVNVNDLALLLAELLKSSGRIAGFEWGEGPRICVEFTGELEVSFEDYLSVYPNPSVIRVSRGREKLERERFSRWILQELLRTASGAEAVEYVPDERIRLRDTEKTATICVRVTAEERARLEALARESGTTISEVVRSAIESFLRGS